MNKLIYLIFSLVLLCQCSPKQENTNASTGQAQTSLEREGKAKARERFDSLIVSVRVNKWVDNKEWAKDILYECLSIAQQLNNDTLLTDVYFELAWYFDDIGEYNLELEYLYKAYEIYQRTSNYYGCAKIFNIIAWIYVQADDNKKGIEEARKGIDQLKNISNVTQRSSASSLVYATIAIAFIENNQPDSALKYNQLAFHVYPNPKKVNLNQYAWVLATFGNIYAFRKEIREAEDNYKKVLEFKDSSFTADASVYTFGKYCHLLNGQNRYRESIAIGREGLRIAGKAGLIRYKIDIANELSVSFEKLQRFDSAYLFLRYARELSDSAVNARKFIQFQNISFNRDLKEKELNYRLEKARADEEIKDAQRIRNVLLIGFVLVMLFAVLFLYQRNKIRAGKIRSDELLLNILPGEVAEELKEKGYSEAKQFNEVTVMFTDFKGFTRISERLSPQELVNLIDSYFKAFDTIINKYNIEKIKTIGDSYMCAGGLPVPNKTNAVDVVGAALEIQQYMHENYLERQNAGQEVFEIRIGVHTGPVVAGIVGLKKFAYDIWGDAVNTASRMESSGEAGKVNISETTYDLVKDKFTCTYRGKISAKGKGEIDMYFVDGRI